MPRPRGLLGGTNDLARVVRNSDDRRPCSVVFFDTKGVTTTEWVRGGQTVNKRYTSLDNTRRTSRRRKRPESRENDSWILHGDNAPAHNTVSVEQFLAENRTPVLHHPPLLARSRSV